MCTNKHRSVSLPKRDGALGPRSLQHDARANFMPKKTEDVLRQDTRVLLADDLKEHVVTVDSLSGASIV